MGYIIYTILEDKPIPITPTVIKLGVATSTDGINFTRSTSNPILSATYNWEANGVAGASIIYADSTLKMVYHNAPGTAFGKAISLDGINWGKSPEPFFRKENTVNGWAYQKSPIHVLLKQTVITGFIIQDIVIRSISKLDLQVIPCSDKFPTD